MAELKDQVSAIVKKITENKDFAEEFKSDPVKAVKSVLGVSVPDGKAKEVLEAVKEKISGSALSSLLNADSDGDGKADAAGVIGGLKNLFGK